MEKQKSKWHTAIKLILILAIISFVVSWIISFFIGTDIIDGNVAIIPISGVIMSEKTRSFGQSIASAPSIVGFIEEADRNPKIKAVIFEINSPGGTPVGSEEIVSAIKKLNKTSVAYIKDIGASGAYWVASATDYIFASRMSITGSVGVIGSYMEFSGLLKDYNVTYQRLVAGKYKDIGSPFKELTYDEERILQKQIDLMQEYFLDDVLKNRNLPKERIEEVKTAKIFSGIEAKEAGLIDEFGGKEEAIKFIEDRLNITAETSEFAEKTSLLDVLSEIMNEKSFFVGKGIGSSMLEPRSSNRIEVWT